MAQLGHHVLLLVAVASLAAAGFRIASALGADGLERYVAATVLAAAAAVLEALALGLVGLGGNPFVLAGAAILTWVACRGLEPKAEPLAAELAAWWRQAGFGTRAVFGAALGLLIAWAAWNLHRPDVGLDGFYYHLPEAVAWVNGGSPGLVEEIHPWLEVGSYPLTNEVLLAWGMAISQSLVWQGLLALLLLPAALAAAWCGLRTLSSQIPLNLLAIGALFTIPFLVAQVDGAANDVPALAWFVCAAGLAAAARARPALLAPMLLAAGLSVGTKTTTLPLVLVLVIAVAIRDRRQLSEQKAAICAAAGAAAVIGLFWYARTFVAHGSPFWPFAEGPWGDPAPSLFDAYTSFRRDPGAALEGNVDGYLRFLSGGWLLLAGALLAPLWSRTRAVMAGAALVLASLLLWSSAPTTGVSVYEQFTATVSQTRYLLPVVALAAVTLVISTAAGRAARTIVLALFAAACVWNLSQYFGHEFSTVVSKTWLAGGALLGGGIAMMAHHALRPAGPGSGFARRLASAAALAALALGGLGLTMAASGYAARYAAQDLYFDAGVARWFEDPSRSADERPIYMVPELFGTLAGDELQRTVELIDVAASCDEVERLNEDGWVILRDDDVYRRELGYTASDCLGDVSPAAEIDGNRIYSPGA